MQDVFKTFDQIIKWMIIISIYVYYFLLVALFITIMSALVIMPIKAKEKILQLRRELIGIL